jgi:coenzyme F420 hydrogenase subunit beta
MAGSKELVETVLEKGICVACGACVGLCPYFKAYQGKIALVFDCDLAQGRCYAHCPRVGVDVEALAQAWFNESYRETELGRYRRVVAARAGERFAKGRFQNGGTVTALVTTALEGGLIEGAILTDSDGILPRPRLVTTAAEVLQCSTTKYMAAPIVAGLNEAIAAGRNQLGVVGTPCQLTAVAQLRRNPLQKPGFFDPVGLSIGLFCTWALDTRRFLAFLADRFGGATMIGMDVPPPPAGVMVIETDSGTFEIPLDDIRKLVPEGCATCPDMTSEWSDLSVGAFEGRSGWNTLIIRTEVGERLVNRATEAGRLQLGEFPAENLAHLTAGAGNKKRRAHTS